MSEHNLPKQLAGADFPASGNMVTIPGYGAIRAWGTSLPSDENVYAKGCLFTKYDGSAGTLLYINEGTLETPSWSAVAALTAAQEALLSATAGTAAASKAVVLDANKDITGINTLTAAAINYTPVTRTATDTGATTGTIASAGMLQFVTVDADGDANHIIILPAPVPGTIVYLAESGTTGYELRTSAPATVGINAGAGENAESAIAGAITLVRCICVSATNWVCSQFDADGDESKVEAAA